MRSTGTPGHTELIKQIKNKIRNDELNFNTDLIKTIIEKKLQHDGSSINEEG